MEEFKASSLRLYLVYKFGVLNIAKLITSTILFILYVINFASHEYLLDKKQKSKSNNKQTEANNNKNDSSKTKKLSS